ncbi:MAG TPA: hypothetical protein VIL30_03525 [Ramlibacter sp.]|jgi:hypothetical protein
MESTLEFLKRHLRAAGADRWPAIAEVTGVAKTLPRKLAYGDRANPGCATVQPLVDFFHEVDAGRRVLPSPFPVKETPATPPAAGATVGRI